jgi:hypothetical protein
MHRNCRGTSVGHEMRKRKKKKKERRKRREKRK